MNDEYMETQSEKINSKLGSWLSKKGTAIGTALVILGAILEGSTGWLDGICEILKKLLNF